MHVLVDGHAMSGSSDRAKGSDETLQLAPALVVVTTETYPELSVPTARQTLVEGQEIASIPIPLGARSGCTLHVDPPSVVT
jgi:hypothetical protein